MYTACAAKRLAAHGEMAFAEPVTRAVYLLGSKKESSRCKCNMQQSLEGSFSGVSKPIFVSNNNNNNNNNKNKNKNKHNIV